MSGPIIRSGPSEKFTANWENAFSDGKSPPAAAEKKSAKKKPAAKPAKASAAKAPAVKAKGKSAKKKKA